jgi:MoxR-like ATPase
VLAASDGRDRVYAEDIKAMLRPVLAHRIMLTPDAVLRGETVDNVIERALSKVKPALGVKNEVIPASGEATTPRRARRTKAS